MDQGRKISKHLQDALLLFGAFLVWAVMFRGYLSGKVSLFDDALSYYDHIKFYLDNISRGVFPLWDSLWFSGSANSFFLQRMGCFNPFLMVTLIFKAMGFSYTTSYLMYLTFYYYLGSLGFYFLARMVIKDRVCAYVAFLLLLFSALGTRSFDSFMILMFTPISWFFYFLVSFGQQPKRSAFVGMFFCVMIVFTTYIPFYFLLSVATFAIVYGVVYSRPLINFFRKAVRFVIQNKGLTVGCVLILLLAIVPGYLFFKAGGKGDFVMPRRNTNQAVGSVLGVQAQDYSNSWAILEDLFFAWHYYTDIRLIKFAIIYIPLLAAVIVLLGLTTKIEKKGLLLFLWMVLLLLICIPIASPVYSFLYDHVIIFKFFRNLHFYLWVTILPSFCLFLGVQLKNYLEWQPANFGQKIMAALYVGGVHGLLMIMLIHGKFPILTSYAVVILSCLFFLWRLFVGIQKNQVLVMSCLLLIAAIEPFEIYSYLSQNTRPFMPYAYAYDWTTLDFRYVRGLNDIEIIEGKGFYEPITEVEDAPGRVFRPMGDFYYASKWFSYLSANVDMYVLKKYLRHKFVIYDSVERLDDNASDFLDFETALAENRNVAYVATDDQAVLTRKSNSKVSFYARQISEPSDDFRVEQFAANQIKIKTKFTKPQFVVYNDNDHREWRLWVNGVLTPIIRSNLAFKGVWVEPGEQTLEFRFGLPRTWLIYLSLLMGINGMFVLILVLWWKEFSLEIQTVSTVDL